MGTAVDTRRDELASWLAAQLPAPSFSLEPASADASFRRYFRAAAGGRSWIAMDAPPGREDCRPFVRVAGMLRAAGVNAPEVLAQDLDRGFLLLTDFGATTYLSALNEASATPLFADAIDALRALAAREPARRAAAVRRSAPAARVRAVSRVVHRAPPRA